MRNSEDHSFDVERCENLGWLLIGLKRGEPMPFDAERMKAVLVAGAEARARGREALRAEQAPFQRELRAAAKPFLQGPWRLAKMGLVCHTQSGHWGHVIFRETHLERRPEFPTVMYTSLVAGAVSPYLFTHLNRKDPTRPPPAGWEALHATTGGQYDIVFSHESDVREVPWPATLSPAERWKNEPVLGPHSVGPWLSAVFNDLVPKTEAMCSDAAILRHLLHTADEAEHLGRQHVPALRYAAMLTRHLGLDEQLPALLERAQAARATSPLPNARRGSNWPFDWSHEVFVEFLNGLPR